MGNHTEWLGWRRVYFGYLNISFKKELSFIIHLFSNGLDRKRKRNSLPAPSCPCERLLWLRASGFRGQCASALHRMAAKLWHCALALQLWRQRPGWLCEGIGVWFSEGRTLTAPRTGVALTDHLVPPTLPSAHLRSERWLAQGCTPKKWQGPGETCERTSAPGTAIFHLPEPILTRKIHSSLRFYLQWSLILWIEVALWEKKESLPWRRVETDAKGNHLKFECSASLESFIILARKRNISFLNIMTITIIITLYSGIFHRASRSSLMDKQMQELEPCAVASSVVILVKLPFTS